MSRSRIGLTLLIFGVLWTIAEAEVRSAPSDEHQAITKPVGGNILLLVADDVGVDKIHAYGEHPETPHTPNIDALAYVETMAEPWFLMVAFNAPHLPRHIPSASLHSRSAEELTTNAERYDALVEALDTEIGRLLSGIESPVLANTTVFFVGDNGTSRHATDALYEGGTNVPFIVTNPVVTAAGSESAALVHVVDIFATAADLAGVQPEQILAPKGARLTIDGRTLLPYLRDPQLPEFYDLEGRRDEEARAAYKRLTAELDRLTEEIVYAGF